MTALPKSFTFNVINNELSRVETDDLNRDSSLYKNELFIRSSPSFKDGRVLRGGKHSFIESALCAYNNHHHLVIRPDDVWLAIVVQFSVYVNQNSEALHDRMVDFQGKKELIVEFNQSIATSLADIPYDDLTLEMTELIAGNIKDSSIRDWTIPNFSTTTQSDKVIGAVVLMSVFQKFFTYTHMGRCGLPRVTLLGTEHDWIDIKTRVEKLREFNLPKNGEMEKWVSMLHPVIDQLILTSQEKPDINWWNRIVSSNSGSGYHYISGWITVFCVFSSSGEWIGDRKEIRVLGETLKTEWCLIDTDDIPLGYTKVPIKIILQGKTYQAEMYAGHISVSTPDPFIVVPQLDWFLVGFDTNPQFYNDAVETTIISVDNPLKGEYTDSEIHPTNLADIRLFQGDDDQQEILLNSPYFNTSRFVSHNSFLESILLAQMSNSTAIFRPDDIWCSILLQMSFYLNNPNQSILREKILGSNTGQYRLNLEKFQTKSLNHIPSDEFATELIDQFSSRFKDESLKSWVSPSFSSTTLADQLTATTLLFTNLTFHEQKSFSFSIHRDNFISSVKLYGTVQDWADLKQRINRLSEFEHPGQSTITDWIKNIETILNEFIHSINNKDDPTNNKSFWSDIIRSIPDTKSIGGWVTTFFGFNKNGDWIATQSPDNGWYEIELDMVADSFMALPLLIDFGNHTSIETELYSGHLGAVTVGQESKSLSPKLDWIVVNSNPEKKPSYSFDVLGFSKDFLKSFISQVQDPFFLKKDNPLLSSPTFKNSVYIGNNAFLGSVMISYQYKTKLVFRPDDIWVAILSQLSIYINSFGDGNENFMEIKLPKQYESVSEIPLELLFNQICDSCIDHDLWIIPNFSTTNDIDRHTGSTALLSSISKDVGYEPYSFKSEKTYAPGGFFSVITVTGTPEDWTELRNKVTKLVKFQSQKDSIGDNILGKWISRLVSVVDQFIGTSKKIPDRDWWSKMFKWLSHNYISGWITTFAVFSRDGKWVGDQQSVQIDSRTKLYNKTFLEESCLVSIDSLANSFLQSRINITLGNEKQYETKLISGHLGVFEPKQYSTSSKVDCILIEEIKQ
eukprot:gene2233-2753_t